MTTSVLVCGEALVDVIPAGGDLYAAKVGGGPFNVAVALGRLGTPVELLTRVSRDAFGERIVEALGAANVGLGALQRGPELTSLAVAGLAPDGSAQYSFYVANTADRLVANIALPDAAVFSFGTLSLVLEPGASVYADLMARAHAARRLVVLDPNVRPTVITDPDAYRARFRSWLPHTHIVKVSEDDAQWLEIGDGEELLDHGVMAVMLTRGGDGLSVLTTSGRIDVPAETIVVSDTIGAGDATHGALLDYLVRHGWATPEALAVLTDEQWRAALEFAAKVAAITCSRPGADPPWASELSSG